MTINFINKVNNCLLQSIFLLFFITISTSCNQEQKAKAQVQKSPKKESKSENTRESNGEKYILFFGNSLIAGYGLEEDESFPSLIQQRIDSLEMNYKVVNAGLSGETTAGGKNRISWILKQPIDIFVLELGANDVLRGFDLKATESNLRSIIEEVQSKKPEAEIIILGMKAPQNLGDEYTSNFASIYTK
ncbi:MAG: arylesterase, partial [Chitinophagales bacterium]|nr:arylesterase [Chitinophagales bacterium]